MLRASGSADAQDPGPTTRSTTPSTMLPALRTRISQRPSPPGSTASWPGETTIDRATVLPETSCSGTAAGGSGIATGAGGAGGSGPGAGLVVTGAVADVPSHSRKLPQLPQKAAPSSVEAPHWAHVLPCPGALSGPGRTSSTLPFSITRLPALRARGFSRTGVRASGVAPDTADAQEIPGERPAAMGLLSSGSPRTAQRASRPGPGRGVWPGTRCWPGRPPVAGASGCR